MLKTTTLVLFFALISFSAKISFGQTKHTISGFIHEKGSREQLIGVNVYIPGSTIGTSSNTYGFYSLTIPARDTLHLIYSYVGYEPITKAIVFNKNIEQNIELESVTTLSEVSVSAKKTNDRVSDNVQMSTIEIPISQIKKIPTLLGEKDVLKVLQLMPGVQKGSEGQSGVYKTSNGKNFTIWGGRNYAPKKRYLTDENLDGKSIFSPIGKIFIYPFDPRNGLTFNGKFYPTKEVAQKTIKVKLLNVNNDFYKNQLSLENINQFDDDNPFVEPVQVYTNIKNGLGCFAGYNISEKVVELK